MVHIIDYKSDNVIVVYLFFAVRQFFEFSEEVVDFLFCERLETKFCQMISEGMTTRVFAQYEVCFFSTYGLRSHDFICFRIAHHTMLMDTRLMSKGVRTYDWFVWWNYNTCQTTHKFRNFRKLFCIDVHLKVAEVIMACFKSHYNFFNRYVTSPFA